MWSSSGSSSSMHPIDSSFPVSKADRDKVFLLSITPPPLLPLLTLPFEGLPPDCKRSNERSAAPPASPSAPADAGDSRNFERKGVAVVALVKVSCLSSSERPAKDPLLLLFTDILLLFLLGSPPPLPPPPLRRCRLSSVVLNLMVEFFFLLVLVEMFLGGESRAKALLVVRRLECAARATAAAC